MGAKVESVTNRIIATLRDANEDSWAEEIIHLAILEAERVVTIFKPDATSVNSTFTCVAGCEQSLSGVNNPPAHALLNVKYNVNPDDTPGRSVRRVAVGDLDAIAPDWRSQSAVGTVRQYMWDEREPLLFYTHPPVNVGTKLKIAYSAVPAPYGAVDANTETTVTDIYEPMLIEWALYRLFGHDTEGSVNISRSQQHLQNFGNMMGIKVEALKAVDPKSMEPRR